ncbi:MAG: radical SAM protein, partial [Phycisphaerae bacterium]
MEIPLRKRDDVFLPDGTFSRAVATLRENHAAHDLRIGIVYAFDFRTRMLPYWFADKRMAPCSVRTLAEALFASGFKHIRVVLQQWTPNFRPSEAVLDGRPLDLLLVSAMQVHAEPSYNLIRDAHQLGESRPLILAGGPKAIYEPTHYFELGPRPGVGADCVVTGEAYVMLEMLQAVLAHRASGESIR